MADPGSTGSGAGSLGCVAAVDGKATPTTKLAPGLHSHKTDAAISSALPSRAIGVAAAAWAGSSSPLVIMSATIRVSIVPGHNLDSLIRIPRGVRRFLPEFIDLIWNRKIDPGKVFDLELPLDQAAAGYEAMDTRQAIKVLLRS